MPKPRANTSLLLNSTLQGDDRVGELSYDWALRTRLFSGSNVGSRNEGAIDNGLSTTGRWPEGSKTEAESECRAVSKVNT